MVDRDDVRWGLARRFEFIEWRAYWLGRVNRGDLEERFGVSTPQASVDLKAYQDGAPNNIEYDPTEKTYIPTENFKPKYLRLSADRYLRQLDAILNSTVLLPDTWFGSLPPADVLPTILRSVEPSVLRAVLRAINGRLELDIVYQSLTNTRRRAIAPHSLAFDGDRWHARAWCSDRCAFRDFLLSRILEIRGDKPSEADPSHDIAWLKSVDLKIIPHPKLDAARRSVIARDYGMKDGRLILKSRVALAFYVIKHLNLDLDEEQIAPVRQQIYLENRTEVEDSANSAAEETRMRTGQTPVSNQSTPILR
jgi:WYL domain